MEERLKIIEEKLKEEGQEHLLIKYNDFNDANKEKLLNQIEKINFDLMKKLYDNAVAPHEKHEIEIEPVEYTDKERMTATEKAQYINKGEQLLKAQQLAAVTMAGGQGTRLGHDKPKGTYDFGVGKSLFEIFCDNLKKTSKKYNVYVPWYIMTSEENHQDTIDFFEENEYFGYPKNFVKFFKQEQLPMVSEDGKILLDEEGLVKEAANGHGGTLIALSKSGILTEMKERGVKWIFVSGVDNSLANFTDPLFLGFAASTGSDIAVKSIEKTDPKEKVGVFCKKNKNIGVVEYSEISEKMQNMRDDYGSLVYGDSNALLHLFSIESLYDICEKRLPYHTAHKKADYIDENGNLVKAEEPNAYKFETFIFDSFEMVDNVNILRVQREEEFAPLKNAKGADSPETAKKLYLDYKEKEKAYDKLENWLKDSLIDDKTKSELNKIKDNDLEIKERFGTDLKFGTAGLRGIMGAGTNRMNKYTVTKATQGVANYIISNKQDRKPVVIAYDTRNNSRIFAEYTALTFNANGIKTYLFTEALPVPVLSYAIRELGAIAGVMITASHNPPEYNGYKLFWDKGSQIVSPEADEIMESVAYINTYSEVKNISQKEAKEQKLYMELGNSIIKSFINNTVDYEIRKNELKDVKKELKISYSPLHGTGAKIIPKTLERLGYENVFVVPEQEAQNGYFPTVEYPNPEDKNANEMVIEYAKKHNADITISTDPDTDRIGVGIKNNNGDYELLTGNQIAIIMLEYILSSLKEKNELPDNGVVISSIVSTNLTKKIAEKYGAEYIETLTGFKYMGEYINQFEKEKDKNFIFAFEESYGYLYGTNARDKDAVSATSMIIEIAAYYKTKGKTLLEALEDIYKEYGCYKEENTSITLKGEIGKNKIKEIMKTVRKKHIKEIGGLKVLKEIDYENEIEKDYVLNEEKPTTLPKSDVMYYELEEDCWIAIRPSGTEPKLKFYIGVTGNDLKECDQKINEIQKYINNIKSTTKETEKLRKEV